jgi:hypothetical protein
MISILDVTTVSVALPKSARLTWTSREPTPVRP